MAEGGGRGRVGQVVSGNIDRLDRGNGSVLGGGDTLLQGAHFVGQGGLVAHGGGHPAHKGGHLGTGLDIPEDIINEKQHILLLTVPEILGHGQAGKGHPHTGSRRFVHLTEDQGGLLENAGFSHLPPKVVSFTGPFSYAGKDGIAPVFGGNVPDQFLNQNGFAHTGAAEQADFAASGVGSQQVDDLDAGLQNLGGGALFIKSGGFPVNGPLFGGIHRALFVNGFSQHIEHPAQGGFPYRGLDGVAGGHDLIATAQTFAGGKQDAAHGAVSDFPGDFHHTALTVLFHDQLLVDLRQAALGELYIHHGTQHLRDHTFVFHSSLSFLYDHPVPRPEITVQRPPSHRPSRPPSHRRRSGRPPRSRLFPE